MDTVQNIGSVIVGANGNQQQDANTSQVPHVDVDNFYATGDTHHVPMSADSGHHEDKSKVFLSRPNWLFGHNENVLFCTALNSLRFRDHNNVPRKFIEEWLSDRMVNMETEWGSGHRFLSETINELKRDEEKFCQKKLRIWKNRQKGFYNRRQQNLRAAERAYAASPSPVTEKLLEDARREAEVPMDKINPPEPTCTEVALEELQTKIIRRLQGQTDRLEMAEYLAHKPYVEPNQAYFEQLQAEVLQAIHEKHEEIAQERDKVEVKSKQSRKRRRNQASNGMTMSGSATRVRFTNREIAMLIHWIYSFKKDDWSARIAEFYTKKGNSRSAEHVRDKLRDLYNRSRDVEHGGLSTIKARSINSYFTKASEPEEVRTLALNDLQDFTYPSGKLEFIPPNGRYFNEERCAWTDGPLPDDYIARYHAEIDRLRDVVKLKVVRTVQKNVMDIPPSLTYEIQQHLQQHNEQTAQHHSQQGSTQENVYDMRLMPTPGIPSSINATIPLLQGTAFSQTAQEYANDADYAMAKNLQESNNNSQLFWSQTEKSERDRESNDDMAALASAALKPETEQYLHLETEEPKSKMQKTD